jgi:hypothetical protein
MTTVRPASPRPKPSWPLLLVAAGAFIPLLGLVFASIGLTWGLVSDRPRAMLGAIIASVGGVLNLAGFVLLTWHVQGDPTYAARRAPRVQQDLARLVGALEEYRAEHGEYPASLVVFTQVPLSLKLVNVTDFSTRSFPVPRLYVYQRSADGRRYDVYGVGHDGEAGTADDVRPELTDSVARHSGYRPSRQPGTS